MTQEQQDAIARSLALASTIQNEIPADTSEIIGTWIICVQDDMTDDIGTSQQWQSLRPLAAGTGRNLEQKRLSMVMDWMWGTLLPTMQATAQECGFGQEWLHMTTHRTLGAATAAEAAARAAEPAWDTDAGHAALAASRAGAALILHSQSHLSAAVSCAAEVAGWAEYHATWHQFDPCGLLTQLVNAR
jgi:hypothetical protein